MTDALTIDQAGPGAVAELLANIHPDDAAELRAARVDMRTALSGVDCQALRWRGQLVALFGLAPHPTDKRGGIPWMLCTRALALVPRQTMAGISAHVVHGWRQAVDRMSNLVHKRNARALRFVRWLGFSVDPTPCGPGAEFFIFTWSRTCAIPSA